MGAGAGVEVATAAVKAANARTKVVLEEGCFQEICSVISKCVPCEAKKWD